jgi:hypothetical protein
LQHGLIACQEGFLETSSFMSVCNVGSIWLNAEVVRKPDSLRAEHYVSTYSFELVAHMLCF